LEHMGVINYQATKFERNTEFSSLPPATRNMQNIKELCLTKHQACEQTSGPSCN
jgi:hypothetical protein